MILTETHKNWQKLREDIVRRAEEREQEKKKEQKREQKLAWKHTRRTRIKGNGGKFTAREWRNLKAFYSFTCLRCKRQEPEIQLTPDHIKPVANGGTSYISNIQPLCLQCNVQKGAKEIDYR